MSNTAFFMALLPLYLYIGEFGRELIRVYVEKFALLSNLIPSPLINSYSVSQLGVSLY